MREVGGQLPRPLWEQRGLNWKWREGFPSLLTLSLLVHPFSLSWLWAPRFLTFLLIFSFLLGSRSLNFEFWLYHWQISYSKPQFPLLKLKWIIIVMLIIAVISIYPPISQDCVDQVPSSSSQFPKHLMFFLDSLSFNRGFPFLSLENCDSPF